MYTRCPQCDTVFRISATQLRVAGGDVRCGNCAHVFSALGNLSDALPDGELDTPHGQRIKDGATEESDTAPGDSLGDSELEFDAPEPTWSKFFIDATRKASENSVATGAEGGDVALDGELETITADPDEWRAFLDEMNDSPVSPWEADDMAPDALGREQQVYVVDDADATGGVDAQRVAGTDALLDSPTAQAPERRDTGTAPGDRHGHAAAVGDATDDSAAEDDYLDADYLGGELVADARLHGPVADTEVSAAAVTGVDSTGGETGGGTLAEDVPGMPAPNWQEPVATEARRNGLWLGASLAMLILLGAQAVHLNRDSLATDEGFGPRLRGLYARLGTPLYPEWPLEAYRVRRAEAMAGGSAPESLDISAAVETTGSGTLGLPLVRVALRDQWANVVASRVFSPEQYLTEPMPEIVPAGTRIPVRLSVVDPGSEARGFVVDLCLPRRSGLDCQLNRDPFAR